MKRHWPKVGLILTLSFGLLSWTGFTENPTISLADTPPASPSSRLPEVATTGPIINPAAGPAIFRGNVAGNHFYWGWCTWWVAQKRSVPWRGNAISWYANAQAMGFAVGSTPRPGAIYVSRENRYYGHTAYVESVNPDGSYVISEMNYQRFGKVDYRTIRPGTTPVVGFIY